MTTADDVMFSDDAGLLYWRAFEILGLILVDAVILECLELSKAFAMLSPLGFTLLCHRSLCHHLYC